MSRKRKRPEKGSPRHLCGRPVSSLVDIGVRSQVVACMNLLAESGRWLSAARSNEFGAECQRRLILNLAWCLHQAAFGMEILADHDAWGSALVLERSALEYYGRAAYFARHVNHAIWVVAVERLQVLIENAASPEERLSLTKQLSEARREYADLTPESRQARGLTPYHQVRIADMIREGIGNEALRRYRAASLVLHGDLYASSLTRRRDRAVNAALLNTASGMVSMSNLVLSWDDKPPRGLTERVLQAEEENQRLMQRHGDAYLIDSAFEPDDVADESVIEDESQTDAEAL